MPLAPLTAMRLLGGRISSPWMTADLFLSSMLIIFGGTGEEEGFVIAGIRETWAKGGGWLVKRGETKRAGSRRSEKL